MNNGKPINATIDAANTRPLRLFVEHLQTAAAMLDNDMRYLAHSPRWVQHFELKGTLLGRSLYDVQTDIAEQWKIVHRRALAGETLSTDEDCYERPDGSVQWVRWEVRPWYQERGVVGGIVIQSEDISARKLAEQALTLSEEKFNTIFREAPAWMTITDWKDATYSDVNDATLRAVGCSRDEVIGRTAIELGWVQPSDRETLLRELKEHGRISELEIDFRARMARCCMA